MTTTPSQIIKNIISTILPHRKNHLIDGKRQTKSFRNGLILSKFLFVCIYFFLVQKIEDTHFKSAAILTK